MAANNMISEKIPTILLRTLASTYQLYFASQNAHWNVEGPNFIQLHSIFKDSYDDASGAVDEIAERIRQLDVKIPNTLQDLIGLSPIAPDVNMPLIDRIYDMHEKIEQQWNSIAVVAEAAEDAATVDMAGKRAGAHGKFCWMLRSLTRTANYAR